jgi:hypothetical protein
MSFSLAASSASSFSRKLSRGVLKHLPRDVTGDVHDVLISGAALGQVLAFAAF